MTLSWGDSALFLSVCSILGLLHVATASGALLGHARWFRIAWALLSWVVQRDLSLVPYQRGRKTFSAPSPELVAQAQAGARQYILGGTQPEVTALERRALGYLAVNALHFRSFATLEASGTAEGGLNNLALPLAAFLTCRPHVGGEFDALIAQLARTLLHVQNQDGSFAASFDLVHANPVNRHKVLYAEGQAVLALVFLEQALSRQHAIGAPQLTDWPELQTVHSAVARAMDYVAHRYWNHPLRGFFFIEENWLFWPPEPRSRSIAMPTMNAFARTMWPSSPD